MLIIPMIRDIMTMLRHEKAFRITGPLWCESTGTDGFPSQKASH